MFVLTTKISDNIFNAFCVPMQHVWLLVHHTENFIEIKFTVVFQRLPILPGQTIFFQSFISSITEIGINH